MLQAGTFQDEASAEQHSRSKARVVLAEAVYNSRLTLEALESLCRGLSGLSGRKTLFLVSDGFITGIADAGTRCPSSAAALRRFRRAESLYVQRYAYHPKRVASGAIDLVAQAEVLRGGARLATATPEPMAAGEPGEPVVYTSRIKLQRFEPGDYELRVTVTDRGAGAMATRSVPFTVE